MTKVKSNQNTYFLFNSITQMCRVDIYKNQIWIVERHPVPEEKVIIPEDSFYHLCRKGVTIFISKEDLDRVFDVVWE